MSDFNIGIKQDDGTVLTVNTDMIEEDVIRNRCGLEPKEQKGDEDIIEQYYREMNALMEELKY